MLERLFLKGGKYVIGYFALSYIPYNVQYLYPILTSIRYGSCELPNLGM